MGYLCQMSKSCKLKQKKAVFGQHSSFHHPGSLSSPHSYSLLFFPSHASLSFPPTHIHCLFPRWMVLLIFTFSPVNEEAVIITDCSPDPEGKCAHSDWLWMVSSVAKVSPGSLLISQSSGNFSCA